MDHVPEINVYMEYEDKTCLDDVLQLYRSCNVKVLNIQITRAAETVSTMPVQSSRCACRATVR